MNIQRILVVLTSVNLAILVFVLTELRPAAAAREVAPVLRGRALEIVDEQGKVRASITVYPASTQKNGERSPETVLLRLITERGRPSVKIGASEQIAGLAFAGPTGTKETWVRLAAEGSNTLLQLKNESGGERVLTP